MKKSLVTLALLAVIGAASAQDASTSTASSNPTAIAGVNNTGSSGASVSGVNAGAQSNPNNQAQQSITFNSNAPAQQSMSSTSTSSSTANVNYSGGTVSTDNVNYSGTQTLKNVPGIAMSGPASGPCTGMSGGVGVAGPGFGVGLNGAKVDDGCTVRENTRVLGQIFQGLPAGDSNKALAADAMLRGMAILDAMNQKIGGDYVKPAPQPAKVSEAPVAAPAVAVAPSAPVKGDEPTDPFVRSRLGLKPLVAAK